MNKINILDASLADKIAAGEVVERPSSVIKELVENSIDASSTKIDIFVIDGGRTLIEVKDNGVGMSKEDAILCFSRHATSKIYESRIFIATRTSPSLTPALYAEPALFVSATYTPLKFSFIPASEASSWVSSIIEMPNIALCTFPYCFISSATFFTIDTGTAKEYPVYDRTSASGGGLGGRHLGKFSLGID